MNMYSKAKSPKVLLLNTSRTRPQTKPIHSPSLSPLIKEREAVAITRRFGVIPAKSI
jgi:hypothetical protein